MIIPVVLVSRMIGFWYSDSLLRLIPRKGISRSFKISTARRGYTIPVKGGSGVVVVSG